MVNRKIIDAHAHIRPARLCGKTDHPLKVTMEPCGRAVLENGTVYQILPPYFTDSRFDPEALIGTMDAFGIEKSILMQSFAFKMNEEIAAAVSQYPDRFAGAMVVDPRDEDAAEQVRKWHKRGLSVIKFEMSNILGFTHDNAYPDFEFDNPDVLAILKEAEKLGITVVIDPNVPGSKGYQVEKIGKIVKMMPQLKVVICHLGFMTLSALDQPGTVSRWKEMLALAGYDNVWFDISALPDLFLDEGYPFKSGLKLVEEFIREYGEEKAIWGSDLPGTLSSATCRQMIEMFEKDENLSDSAKNRLFYDNAVAAYF